jgi:hypothetical protein
MEKKHRKTFEALLQRPDRTDIDWEDFLNLLTFLGAIIKNQSGAAFGIRLNGEYAVFHKPHPGHTIYTTDLKRIRKFLTNAGVENVE